MQKILAAIVLTIGFSMSAQADWVCRTNAQSLISECLADDGVTSSFTSGAVYWSPKITQDTSGYEEARHRPGGDLYMQERQTVTVQNAGTFNEFGIEYTQRDVDLRDKVALCDNHEVGANAQGVMTSPPSTDPVTHQLTNMEWQAPCQKVRDIYRDSGAQGKWQEIRRRQAKDQLRRVTEGLD